MESLDRLKITVLAEDSVGYERSLLGQHGISLLLEAWKGAVKRNILVDVGQYSHALLFNMKQLGIDPGCIDVICITHCHYDHTGGIVDVLKAVGKRDLPVVAHPETFRLHFKTDPYLRHIGVAGGDLKAMIEEAGGVLFLCRDPLELMPGITTSGEVKRETDFERVGIPLRTLVDGRLREDTLPDDVSVAAKLANGGCAIVTGCSHAGIVNIVRSCGDLTGTNRIEYVVGGFHLVEAEETRIAKTVEALASMDVRRVASGHCTGFRAQVAFHLKFKDRFTPLTTGMTLEL
jgi:7,8-dihydropterin-6-yl-methyl-4-(beta-D-ribofuranosyl)aminobenzene 5'-phosphate synthase